MNCLVANDFPQDNEKLQMRLCRILFCLFFVYMLIGHINECKDETTFTIAELLICNRVNL